MLFGGGALIWMSVEGKGLMPHRHWIVPHAHPHRPGPQGLGVNGGEKRRLFRAFHKSALDAAHDKPGVGLGLALCRRLARALGGDLRLGRKSGNGACLVLQLP